MATRIGNPRGGLNGRPPLVLAGAE